MEKSVLRQQVDELLRVQYQPGDPIRDRIGDLLDDAYDGASEEEWEDVKERYEKAFALNSIDREGGTASNGRGIGSDALQDGAKDVQVGGNSGLHHGQPRGAQDQVHLHGDPRPSFDTLITGGFYAKYLEWTEEHESPSQYHFGAAITAVAAGLGRRPLIEWEARDLYPNLYTLLVGPSGARKGAAIERAMRLVIPTMGANRLPNEGTPQGFFAALKRRLADTELDSDGIITAPEFGVLMSRNRNKEDLVKWLTDWYDSPGHWDRALRGEEEGYELFNVCISVLGGSTLTWLRDMPSDAITGGFMPRFILFDAQGKRFWKSRPKFNKHLEQELSHRLARITSSIPDRIGWGDDAGDILDEWYERDIKQQHDECTDEQFKRWLDRKQAAAMKLAVVWQLTDGGPKDEIAKEWLTKAIDVITWGDYTVERVYDALGVTQEGQAAADVLDNVKRLGGSATLRQLCAALKKSYTKSRVQGALNTLPAAGDLRREYSPSKGLRWELK